MTFVGLCSFKGTISRKRNRTSDTFDESDDSDDHMLEISPFEIDSKLDLSLIKIEDQIKINNNFLLALFFVFFFVYLRPIFGHHCLIPFVMCNCTINVSSWETAHLSLPNLPFFPI